MGAGAEKAAIETLTALRFFAILIICLHHLSYPLRFSLGEAGVAFFFVLSGFVMGYAYSDRFARLDRHELAGFYMRRLNKIYPLHLLTFIASLPLVYAIGFQTTVISGICSVLLLQSYYPIGMQVFAFNGVAWFMSNLVFFYLLAPFILNALRRTGAVDKASVLFSLLLVFFMVETSLALLVANQTERYSAGWWLVYISPYARLFDCAIGLVSSLLLAKVINKRSPLFSNRYVFSVLEVLALASFGMSMYFAQQFPYPSLRLAVYFIPFSLAVVVVFAFQRGAISSALRSRIPVYLGNLSFTIYLVHQLLIVYVATFITSKMMGMRFTASHMASQALLLLAIVGFSDLLRRYFVDPASRRISILLSYRSEAC